MKSAPLSLFLLIAFGVQAGSERDPERDHERDHERARDAQRRGEFVPLERILADVERQEPGKVIDVELDDDEYEIEVLRADGSVVELEYDARTGRLIEREVEDD
jgi:uncharacterized membrane protein YkoI